MKSLKKNNRLGFTIIEMLIVISIIAVITAAVIVAGNRARIAARDAERINTMGQVVLALERYHEKYRGYPAGDGAGCGGWDTPGNGTFIDVLRTEGFLTNKVKDPKGDSDCGNYRYYKYAASLYGCPADYYVLEIMDMEKTTGKHKESKGWACGTRDWTSEAEWVTGHFQ